MLFRVARLLLILNDDEDNGTFLLTFPHTHMKALKILFNKTTQPHHHIFLEKKEVSHEVPDGKNDFQKVGH